MKLFHDDRELVKELLSDRNRLSAEMANLKSEIQNGTLSATRAEIEKHISAVEAKIDSLIASNEKLIVAISKILRQQGSWPRIPVPPRVAAMIDYEKLGIKPPEEP